MTQRNLIKIFGYLCIPIFEIIQLSSSTVSFLVSLLLVDYLLLRVMLGDLARQSRFMPLLRVLKVFFRGPYWLSQSLWSMLFYEKARSAPRLGSAWLR
jgi:hypothetical protein